MTAPTPTLADCASTTAAPLQPDDTARLRTAVWRIAKGLRPGPAASEGLSPSALDALGTVARCGPIGLSELARVERLNPTMLSRLAAKLEGAGLVRRVQHSGDGRTAALEATDAGRALRERVLAERSGALNAALALVSDREREQIVAALPALEALAEVLRS